MTENNQNQQDITKIYELIQKNNEQIHKENRLNRITGLIQTFLVLLPTLFLIWEKLKGKKLSPKKRLMKNEAAQARLKLHNETTQAKLQLEREIILKEVHHETELNKMETGLDNVNDNLNFLTNLKEKGENLIKDKVGDKLKEIGEKTKGIKDKFLNSEKKEKT